MSNSHRAIIHIVIVLICSDCIRSANAEVINYWRFEEGSGSFVADSTGLADGILDPYFPTTAGAGDSGELGWSTNTPFSIVPQTQAANLGSLHFAPGPGVTLSPTAPMNYGASFTVELFFSLDTIPTYESPNFFLNFFDTDTQLRLAVWRELGGGVNFQILASTETGGAFFNTPNLSLAPDTWYHFAFVNDDGDYLVYLDGLPVGAPVSGGGGEFNFAPNGGFSIGTDLFSGGFDGYMDEIRISNEALDPSEFLNVIPEPSTFALVLGALAAVTACVRRRLT
jgi:hypothetical protein